MKIKHWAHLMPGRGPVGGHHETDGWKGHAPCGVCGKQIIRGMGRWWNNMGWDIKP